MNYKLRSYLKLFWLTLGLVFFLYEGRRSSEVMAESGTSSANVITSKTAVEVMQKALLGFLIKRTLDTWLFLDNQWAEFCTEKSHPDKINKLCDKLKKYLLKLNEASNLVHLHNELTLSTLTGKEEFLSALKENLKLRLKIMFQLKKLPNLNMKENSAIMNQIQKIIIDNISFYLAVLDLFELYETFNSREVSLGEEEPLTYLMYSKIFHFIYDQLRNKNSSCKVTSNFAGILSGDEQFFSKKDQETIEQRGFQFYYWLLNEMGLDFKIFAPHRLKSRWKELTELTKLTGDRQNTVGSLDDYVRRLIAVYARSYLGATDGGGAEESAHRNRPCGLILRRADLKNSL